MRGIAAESNWLEYGEADGFAPTSMTPYGPYEVPPQLPWTARELLSGLTPNGRAIVWIL